MKRYRNILISVSVICTVFIIASFVSCFLFHSNKIISIISSMLFLDFFAIVIIIVYLNYQRIYKEYKQYELATGWVEKNLHKNSNQEEIKPIAENQVYSFENMNRTFYLELIGFINQRHALESDVFAKAHIPCDVLQQIDNPEYRINKKYVFALALCLKLDSQETKRLLNSAGYFLNETDRFDLYAKYYIEHELYNLAMIEQVLEEKELHKV